MLSLLVENEGLDSLSFAMVRVSSEDLVAVTDGLVVLLLFVEFLDKGENTMAEERRSLYCWGRVISLSMFIYLLIIKGGLISNSRRR